MRFPIFSLTATLFICVLLSASTALGQSLDIKNNGTNYWVEANAPAGSPHTLQASADFNLWVGLRDEALFANATVNKSLASQIDRKHNTSLRPQLQPITLAIHLNSTNKVSLEATLPLNLSYRFQASADHENWEDMSDQVSGSLTYGIDSTQDVQFFRLRAWTNEDAPITLVMVGDSTVADFDSNSDKFYGWGQGIYGYMKPNVLVVNYAVPLQSSRSFLSSVQRDNLIKIKPDFVLVQFGLVDSSTEEYFNTSLPAYEANLRTIIQLIRDFKGTPILVTPPVLRGFDAGGRVIPFLEDRCAVVRKLSAELQTYLIDLNQLSRDLYNQLGPTDSTYITSNEGGDIAHFSEAGSKVIARLIVDAFPSVLHSQAVE
jgi:lysophospholipase L1-like esterase